MAVQRNLFWREKESTRQILADPEKTLPALIFSITGRIICKITKRKETLPWYFSLIVLALVIQLPTLIIVNLLRESAEWRLLGFTWMGYIELGLSATTIARFGVFYLYRNINQYVLDKIQKENDLQDLQRVLARAWSNRSAVYFTLAFTLFWCISFSLVYSVYYPPLEGRFIGFGLFVGTIIFGLLTGPALYQEGWFFLFIIHVGNYTYDLSDTMPAYSEVISQLSRIITNLLYSFSLFIAFATFAVLSNPGAVLLVTLIGWIPTIIYFIGTQRSLSKIITSAKWKAINRIQQKIKLLHEGNLNNKRNMEALNRLMDYHERIRVSPNSTLNIVTGLSLINQLALPLTGLLLANTEKIINFFK